MYIKLLILSADRLNIIIANSGCFRQVPPYINDYCCHHYEGCVSGEIMCIPHSKNMTITP